jgi:uncharacterized protein YcfJ
MGEEKMGRKIILTVVALLALSFFVGCRTYEEQGTAWGALAGGVIGYNSGYKNRDRAALVGAVLGGAIGHHIGEDMDREEAWRQSIYRNQSSYYER